MSDLSSGGGVLALYVLTFAYRRLIVPYLLVGQFTNK